MDHVPEIQLEGHLQKLKFEFQVPDPSLKPVTTTTIPSSQCM